MSELEGVKPEMTNLQVLELWYRDVWENGDIDAVDRYMRPQMQARGLLHDMFVAPEDMKNLIEVLRGTMKDLKVNILMSIEQDGWLAAVVQHKAVSIRNGAALNSHGHVMIRFEDGYIVEAYNCFDFMTFFEQQEQLPANTMALLLTGTELS